MDKPWINDKNCFVVDMTDPDESDTILDRMPRRVTVPVYVKKNCNDMTLDIASDFTQFLLSLSGKSNVGIHIDRYYDSVSELSRNNYLDNCKHFITYV